MRVFRETRRTRRRAEAGLIIALLAVVSASPPAAAVDWKEALTSYAENPFRNRRALLRLRREHPHALPPLYLLALGDAALRARRYEAAGRQFEAAIDRGLGEPWVGWARVGLAWIALAREEYPEARRQFEAVAESAASPSVALARHAVALLDAAAEQEGIAAQFEAVAADEEAAPDIRRAARLGRAYAFYWQEDYARAAEAFEAFSVSPDVGSLWDDARYAAAWARLRAGDRDAAEAALTTLAAGRDRRSRAVPRALVNLEPQAIMRAGFERFRHGPLDAPEAHLARILDGDGYALAAAALRRLGSGDHPPPAPLAYVRARLRDGGDGEHVVSRRPAPQAARPAPRADRRREPATTGGLPLAGGAAILFLAFGLWWWLATHRRPPKTGRR